MRIAIYHNLPSGGAKRTLYEEVRYLATDHLIDVYTLSSANHEFADVRPLVANHRIFNFLPSGLFNSPLGRLNQIIRMIDLYRLSHVTRNIAAEIDAENYDVLLVHPCQFEKSPSVLRHIKHVNSVYYCHESARLLYEDTPERPYNHSNNFLRQFFDQVDPLPVIYQRYLKQIDWQNMHSASRVIVNSKFTQGEIRRIYKLEPEISYHGVDSEFFRPLTVEKMDMILSVGSLTPLKGFDFIIKSLVNVPKSQRPIFIIASNFQNTDERVYLEQLVSTTKIDVRMVSNVSDKDLLLLYNQAKLTVYAPYREPFGLVPLESMACGTPVIAVKDGGIQETVIHGQTGYLVERDPRLFASAVHNLLSDSNQLEEFGQNARRHIIKNWTWKSAIDRLQRHLTFL